MLDHFESENQKLLRGGPSVNTFFSQVNQPLLLNDSVSTSSSIQHSLASSATTSLTSGTNNNSTNASSSSIESERLTQLEHHTSSNQIHDQQQQLNQCFPVDFNSHQGCKYEQLSSNNHMPIKSAQSPSLNDSKTHMIPAAAHIPEHQIQGVLQMTNKHEASVDSGSAALNFSQSTLHHAAQLSQQSLQQPTSGSDIKQPPVSRNFDSSNLLAQGTSTSMNMWKNHHLSLNHFKHSVMSADGFFHNPDLSTLSTWSNGGQLGHHHQPTSLQPHSALDISGYSAGHSRGLPMTCHQDLMGAKSHVNAADQTSFMLHTMNHQSTPLASHSGHQKAHLDTYNFRPHHQDHASYNFTMTDCQQLYNSSRSDPRSHTPSLKPPFFMHDRPDTSAYNQTQSLTYPTMDHSSFSQPSTSQTHSGKTTNNFQCNVCGQVFPLKNVYQSHMKTHSQNRAKIKFKCERCGSCFSQKTSLNRHMKAHTGERPFQCTQCTKAFSEKERLKIHMRTHTGEKPFQCGICGKSFSQKSTVKRHQTVHTGEKKFRCDCGKGFANRGNLIAHIKARGPKHHNE